MRVRAPSSSPRWQTGQDQEQALCGVRQGEAGAGPKLRRSEESLSSAVGHSRAACSTEGW